MFSDAERARRLKKLNEVMESRGLDAIYLPGNSTVGTNAYGDYRYLTDNRVIFYLSNVIMPRGGEPIGVAANTMSKVMLTQKTFVKDVVIDLDQLNGIIGILKQACSEDSTVGTLLEVLPAAWLKRIHSELPKVRFVDITNDMFLVRMDKSAEEVEAQRVCGRIADAGYRAVCEALRPGMYENEVIALLDREMQRMGSEESFSLITSGGFNSQTGDLPALHNCAASNRRIEAGDVLAMEITPRYYGYWCQLVRTICVGSKNEAVDEFRGVVCRAIAEATKILKPGVKIGELYDAMKASVEAEGYRMAMPCGHICAMDLNEERITPNNERPVLEGMVVILHPTVLKNEMETGIYWGESYLVTSDGCEALAGESSLLEVTKG